MSDLLTTRQVLELLKVDRITVYRMLQDGRLKGVKIGQQWRFTQREVDRLLQDGAAQAEAPVATVETQFPVHCIQTIQNLFSEIGQISAVVLDGEGRQVTEVSHPTAFFQLLEQSASAQAATRASWAEFTRHCSSGSRFFTCHAGLRWIAAPVLGVGETTAENGEIVAIFLAGQFTWEAPDAREEAERLRRLATAYSLPLADLQQAARAIPVIEPSLHARVESWPFTAASAVQSILHERSCFMDRLQRIADLTQIS